jgi:Domain of unknown function (DUF1707)/Cell wall-active antibiotics response 4TMS YvqF
MDSGSARVSDAEREQAVVLLREHLLAGRLTLDEFTARAEAALGAQFGTDLARVQADLPRLAAQAPGSRRRAARFTAGVLGRVARRGRLRLHNWTVALTVFADVDFDLREATIDRAATTMTVLAFCGNLDVYVPEGVNVDVSGLALFGHRRDWGNEVTAPDAPTITVRVAGLFGTVDVWRVPAALRDAEWGDIMRHLEGKPPRQLPSPG